MKLYTRPQNITDWVIAGGFILSLVIYAFRRILIFSNHNYDFLPIFARLIIFGNYELLGLGIVMCVTIISGLQKLNTSTKRNGLSYLITGFLIASSLIGINVLVSSLFPYLTQKLIISDEKLAQIELKSDKESIRPDLQSRLKEIVAEVNFLKTGVVSKYVDANGETVEYKPTFETIKIRKSIEKILSASAKARTWLMVWSSILIASLLIGSIFARYKVMNKIKRP
jgi:hypothetical protein